MARVVGMLHELNHNGVGCFKFSHVLTVGNCILMGSSGFARDQVTHIMNKNLNKKREYNNNSYCKIICCGDRSLFPIQKGVHPIAGATVKKRVGI